VQVLTLSIRSVEPETPRAHIVRLDLADHRFEYAAGQAVLIAAHGNPNRRPYSIAAAPEEARRDGALELLIGREPSDPSDPRFAPRTGDLVDLEGPLGSFTFPATTNERRFLFVAGGIGIAPLRAMLRHALVIPHAAIGLFYSARTPDDFAYGGEFRALAAHGKIDLHQTVTRWSGEDWDGARGRVNRHSLAELVHDRATLCFVCGPPAMVAEVPRLLEDIGVVATRIHVERYG
jgi:NAD(P)H-flavin reductase